MRKSVYIFTGAEYIEIGAEYFFQHPFIQEIDKDSVVKIYYTSKVGLYSIKDLIQASKEKAGAVSKEMVSRFTPEFIEKLESGIKILEVMVKDLIGNEEATKIINKPIRSIVEEMHKING